MTATPAKGIFIPHKCVVLSCKAKFVLQPRDARV